MRVLSLSIAVLAGAILTPDAAAVSPASAPTAETGSRPIIIGAGDTVYGLARRFGVAPQTLIALNDLEAPYALKIGQEFLIPAGAADHTGATRTAAAPAPAVPTAKATPVAATPDTIRPVAAVKAPTPLQYEPAAPAEPAPVLTAAAPRPAALAETAERLDALYTVKTGDTLFSIAQRFGADPAPLAAANGLTDPYTLSVGQRLIIPAAMVAPRIPVTEAAQSVPQVITGAVAPVTTAVAPATDDIAIARRELGLDRPAENVAAPDNMTILVSKSGNSRFSWPLRGALIAGYGIGEDGEQSDGIKIAAPVGAPIRAAADGEVIYTGAELEGYGNLLLIRHEDGWVSAYAHTDTIMVGKGEKVQQGEVVAKVGHSGEVEQPQLHFELRHQLQPRDPLAALNGQDTLAVAVSQ